MAIDIDKLAQNYYNNKEVMTVQDIRALLRDVYNEGILYANGYWLKYQQEQLIMDQKDGLYDQPEIDGEEEEQTINTKPYYKGKDSLYKFAQEWQLNAYEFDIIKRIIRCRHKGQFKEDLQKTKDLIDIYAKEHNAND